MEILIYMCPYMCVCACIFNCMYIKLYIHTQNYWPIYMSIIRSWKINHSYLSIPFFFLMNDILQTWGQWRFPAITLCSKCLALEFHIFSSYSEGPCLEGIWYFAEAQIWVTLQKVHLAQSPASETGRMIFLCLSLEM